jgi:hypothetical protein
MGTFNDGDSGSSIRTKLNAAIEKTEGTSAISTIDVDGGAIDGVTLGTNSAVTEAQVDNININGNTISSTDTNGDVTIDPNGAGDVNIGNFKFDADQTVGAGQDNYVLTYDNSGGKISLEAAAGGGSLSGNMAGDIASNSHEIKFADSGAADENRLTFGASDDLEIYHDGSNSYIDSNGTGNLYIRDQGTGSLKLQGSSYITLNSATNESYLVAQSNNAVRLYYDNNEKIRTDTAGVIVTGTASVNAIAPVSGNLSVSNMTYNEVQYASLGTTGTLTPDPANGSVQKITLTGNITINAMGGSPAAGDSVTLIIVQPSSGNYTLTSTMKFAGGTKTLSTTSNYIDVVTIYYDGTNYLANLATNFS